jgi:hypothetical protein
VELVSPARDEQAILDGLLATIADLGGWAVAPSPEADADRPLAKLEALVLWADCRGWPRLTRASSSRD